MRYPCTTQDSSRNERFGLPTISTLNDAPRPLRSSPPGRQETNHEDDVMSAVGVSPHTQPDYLEDISYPVVQNLIPEGDVPVPVVEFGPPKTALFDSASSTRVRSSTLPTLL